METWLRYMLIDAGHLTHQGLSRRARIIPCRRCKLPTIAGLDNDLLALDAWCDLDELDPRHELDALLDGRDTYELTPAGHNRYQLTPRDQFTVTRPPRHPLIASHRCNDPIPTTWHAPEQLTLPNPDDPHRIPF